MAKTVRLIRQRGGTDILVVGGGIIPKKDIPKLREAGIAHTFGPGTSLKEIIKSIETSLAKRSNDDKEQPH